MKLGFDIDEVVCDLTKGLSDYIQDKYKIIWPVDCWRIYSLEDCDYTGCGDSILNKKITGNLLELAYDLEFLVQCVPVEGAVKALQSLKRLGHTLHYITAREEKKEHLTIKWLRENKIPFDSVCHVGYYGEKGTVGRSLNLDFFLDDLEHHLKSMLRYKKRWKKSLALLDKPWNSDYDGGSFVKLHGWSQVIRHLGVHNR